MSYRASNSKIQFERHVPLIVKLHDFIFLVGVRIVFLVETQQFTVSRLAVVEVVVAGVVFVHTERSALHIALGHKVVVRVFGHSIIYEQYAQLSASESCLVDV